MSQVTGDVRVARGTAPLAHRYALPPIPNAPHWRGELPDRIGKVVQQIGMGIINRGSSANHGAASVTGGSEKLKVLTFNVRGAMGPTGFGSSEADLKRIVETIKREKPDVVILQELDRFAARSNFRNQLDELARMLGAESAVAAAPGMLVSGREQQVAVLTFNGFKVDSARNIVHLAPGEAGFGNRVGNVVDDAVNGFRRLVLRQKERKTALKYDPRNTIDTMVVSPAGRLIRVLGAHYSWAQPGRDPQKSQVDQVAANLAAWKGPTLIGADFNVRSSTKLGERERRVFSIAGLQDAFTAVGILPGDARRDSTPKLGVEDIDRIYVSNHFRVASTQVLRQESPTSDHYGVVSELILS